MGSLKLPHASGNSMSIAAPATNPASDLELKLPATIGTANQVVANGSTPGTLEFVHVNNTPLFWVKQGSNQNVTSGAHADITLDTETYDTDSAFNTSTYTFTVPSGKGGLYVFHWNVRLNSVSDGSTFITSLYKNGTEVDYSRHRTSPGSTQDFFHGGGATLPLAANDAIMLKAWSNGGNTTTESSYTYMSGHRLLGV